LPLILLLGRPLQKTLGLRDPVVSNQIGMKFGKIVLQLNTRRSWIWISDMTSYIRMALVPSFNTV